MVRSKSVLAAVDNEEKLKAKIVEIVEQRLAELYPPNSFKSQIKVKRLPLNFKDKSYYDLEDIRFTNSIDPRAYETIDLIFKGEEKDAPNYNLSRKVQVYIRLWQYLPLIRKNFSSGEQLTKDDFQYEWYEITRLSAEFVEDTKNIEAGMVLARLLRKGQPLRPTDLVPPPIVFAGEEVKLIYQNQGLQIQLICTAREDAAKGDIIHLYSPDSRQTYAAEILAPGLAKWKSTR